MMKKILILTTFIFCYAASFAQFPNNATQSNASTLSQFGGGLIAKGGFVNTRFPDTATANLSFIKGVPNAQIVVGNTVYLRDSTAKKWIVAGGFGVSSSTISIYNDSTLLVCNTNSCDSFKTNIVISNFTVLNDSTIKVCPTSGSCDTVHINPTPIAKTYVDSVKILNGVLYYYLNGIGYSGGGTSTTTTNGTSVVGGFVSYSNTGLTYNVTPAYFTTPYFTDSTVASQITLSTADPTYSRIDAVVATKQGVDSVVTGLPAVNPELPQIDQTNEVLLAYIIVTAGETSPTVATATLYDQDTTGEWTPTASGFAPNFASTLNPYHSTKAIHITSWSNGNTITLSSAAPVSTNSYSILTFYIYLSSAISNTTNVTVQFYNGAGVVGNTVTLSSAYGFSKTVTGSYQAVAIPFSALGLSGNVTKMVTTFSKTNSNSSDIDWIQFKSSGGTTGGGGGTGTGNYVTNVFRKAATDSVFQVINNVTSFAFITSDTTTTYLKYPLWADGVGDTIKIRTDSLPKLTYGAGVDTSTISGRDLPTADWVNARLNNKQNNITLTTTGTSGAATLSGSTLNIPQYSGGSGSTVVNDSIAKGFLISDSGVTQGGLTPMDLTWDKVHQQRYFSVIDNNFINYKSAYPANMTFEDTTICGSTPTVVGSNLVWKGSNGISMMRVKTGPVAAWCTVELNIQSMSSRTSNNILGPALIQDSMHYIAGVYDAANQMAYIQINRSNVLTKSINLDSSFIKLQLVITGTSVALWAESYSNRYFIGIYNSSTSGLEVDSTLKSYKYGIYQNNSSGDSSINTILSLRAGASGGGGLLNVKLVTNEDGSPYVYGNKIMFTADLEGVPNGGGSIPYQSGNSSVFTMDMSTFQVETVGRFFMKRSNGGSEIRTVGCNNIKLIWFPSVKKWLFVYAPWDWPSSVATKNDSYAWLDYEAPFGQTILDSTQLNNFGINTSTYNGQFYDASVRKINGSYYVLGAYKPANSSTANPIIFSGTSLTSLTTANQYATTTFLESGNFVKLQGKWYINYFTYGDTKGIVFDLNLDSLGYLNLPFAASPGTSGIPGYEWLSYQKNGKTIYYLVGFDSQNLTLNGTEDLWTRGNLVIFKAQQVSTGYEFPNRISNQITFPIKDVSITSGKFPVSGIDQYMNTGTQTFTGNKTFSGSVSTGPLTATTISTVTGSTGTGGTLTLQSTSSISKGKILFGASAYNDGNDRLGLTTATPTCTLDLGTYNSTLYTFKTGNFLIEPSALNNGSLADNGYYNGSSWTRVVTGYSSGFQFYNGQLLVLDANTGSGTFTPIYPFKTDFSNSGSVALGGNVTASPGSYTGSTMVVTSIGASIGSAAIPNASSILDLSSTTKGFLPPRMTNAQKGAISSPATGLTIYCTDCTATDASTGVLQTYNGSTWKNAW